MNIKKSLMLPVAHKKQDIIARAKFWMNQVINKNLDMKIAGQMICIRGSRHKKNIHHEKDNRKQTRGQKKNIVTKEGTQPQLWMAKIWIYNVLW